MTRKSPVSDTNQSTFSFLVSTFFSRIRNREENMRIQSCRSHLERFGCSEGRLISQGFDHMFFWGVTFSVSARPTVIVLPPANEISQ